MGGNSPEEFLKYLNIESTEKIEEENRKMMKAHAAAQKLGKKRQEKELKIYSYIPYWKIHITIIPL